MKQIRPLIGLAAAFALTGCFSFGGKVPETLLRLTPSTAVAANTGRTAAASEAITVVEPTVPQELRTPRVPVRTGGIAVAYVKDAQWVENPSALFGRLVSETITATTGRVTLDPRQFTFDPGLRLTGQLQSFGMDADTREAVVVYDAALARGENSVTTRRFEARVPVAEISAEAVGPALNQAANQVAAEVAAWLG